MIAIIDYGMGNLRSVQKAFERIGATAIITDKSDVILNADKIVLPGVGAMRPAMDRLNELKLIDPIKQTIQSKKSFLGICLGYQLLFESSNEGGEVKGIGIIKGNVTRFTGEKVPQMGWNQIKLRQSTSPLFQGIPDQANVYFCHSYYVKPADQKLIAATTNYGIEFASAIANGTIFGVQFHPEKSQSIGLTLLSNFAKL